MQEMLNMLRAAAEPTRLRILALCAHSEFTVTERIGEAHSLYHGIALDYDWALVPGNWTLEIWSGDRILASEVFTLIR